MKNILFLILAVLIIRCTPQKAPEETSSSLESKPNVVVVEAESFNEASSEAVVKGADAADLSEAGWMSYIVEIPKAGRYKVEVKAKASSDVAVWVEDYIDNPDGRTYNVSGDITFSQSADFQTLSVDGSPFNQGTHAIKLHAKGGPISIDNVTFTLIKEHQTTPKSMTQSTEGENWEIAWTDEFDGTEVDTTKWTYDIGNWGWGNNELQYYTANRPENTRIEDGVLIIEARKNDMGQKWTSARLTTRGKVSFLYGKIEFKARVPAGKGNWTAAWTLGDSFVDEIDWPYCGEIDILESVGYEVDQETLDGIAHATVHTPDYYFKANNQISSTKDVKNIAGEFHTYSVEWTPTEIKGFVDGEQYYLYDKTANEREWPFNNPQNIIINLAMGGGWGGAKGMDTTLVSQKFELDYVRVYQKM